MTSRADSVGKFVLAALLILLLSLIVWGAVAVIHDLQSIPVPDDPPGAD